MTTHSPLPSWIWNGSDFVPCDGLPFSDRGARYGMSIFESIAVRHGHAEFLTEHLVRLESSCRRLGWAIDCHAFEKLRPLLEGYGREPIFARVYNTAGDGGPLDPVTAPRLFVFAEHRRAELPPAASARALFDQFVPIHGGTKTGNYWPNVIALGEARAAGCDEGLLFNPEGELVSACMANVFVVHDGVIKTPPAGVGTRRGVVREWVVHHGEVQGAPISREDLEAVTECFLTNSWVGIMPVNHLNGRTLETKTAGELRHLFWETIRHGSPA